MLKLPSGKSYLDPAFLLEKLEVKGGMYVADFGCGGSGYFALQAAGMVGDKGRVYAIDIFKPNLSAIWRNIKMRGYQDVVRCVWSDLEIEGAAKKIKDGSVDRGILVNVLHQSKKQKEIYSRKNPRKCKQRRAKNLQEKTPYIPERHMETMAEL